MNKLIGATAALVVLLGAGAAYYFSQMNTQGNYGPAAPRTDAADVPVDWLLSEGELALGNQNIMTPVGVNLKLLVDSDKADAIEISGLGVRTDLAADAVTPVYFNIYKSGQFAVRLSSSGEILGRITGK